MTDVTRVTAVPRLPPRKPDSHKGDYGRVLVVAGSRGMTGAAVLCGGAALRGGAGLVTVACPADVQDVVAAGNPCYMTAGLPCDDAGGFARRAADPLRELVATADVVALGPGLGRGDGAGDVIHAVFGTPARSVVLDADGLDALTWEYIPPSFMRQRPPAVLTPHPGEFGRMIGKPAAGVQASREPLAVQYARASKDILLLKGHRTVVTDGTRLYVNDTGNPGMATGGCGDVLTGLIAALIGQGLGGFDAAVLGAWVHGRAGDLAAADLGQTALTALDVLAYLPRALREVGP